MCSDRRSGGGADLRAEGFRAGDGRREGRVGMADGRIRWRRNGEKLYTVETMGSLAERGRDVKRIVPKYAANCPGKLPLELPLELTRQIAPELSRQIAPRIAPN